MTRYGWDASDYDWARGPMDVAKAHSEGIDLLTHKISEGTGFRAVHAGEVLRRGAAAGVPVLGGYHVLMPAETASISAQLAHYLDSLDAVFPEWREHPCFIHQIDAEKFSYMKRRPSLAEINQFGHGAVAKAGCAPTQVIAYAPHWLYGDDLRGLDFHLWASAYVTGSGGFKALYPGDQDGRWAAYSGITPTALQYTSGATIAGQHPADANALRVDTVEQLVGLFVPHDQEDDPMSMYKTRDEFEAALEAAAHRGAVKAINERLLADEEHPHGMPHQPGPDLREVAQDADRAGDAAAGPDKGKDER